MPTVSEMDTTLELLLGDPNERRWSQVLRLEALNLVQRSLAIELLGSGMKRNFDLVLGIQDSKSIDVGTTGYALSGLHPTPGRMLTEAGFMRAEITLGGAKQRCVRYTPDLEGLSQNQYLRGSNEYPVIRFEANSVYVDVDDGEYPVEVELFYIRDPKTMVISGASGYQVTTCELDVGLHSLIIERAELLLRRAGDDFDQASVIRTLIESSLARIVRSGDKGVKTGTPGQYLRKQEEKRDAV